MATQTKSQATRRDFLYVATGAVGAVGVAAVVWPLIDQMNPDASTLAMSSIEFDLSPIEVGQTVTIKWRGLPVFVRHRTAEDIAAAEATPMDQLKDPEADSARVAEGHPEWLIMVANCTHLGCIPTFAGETVQVGTVKDGWFCPCHGSQYDMSGRILKGPAPANLVVPPYQFLSDTLVQIG